MIFPMIVFSYFIFVFFRFNAPYFIEDCASGFLLTM